MDECATGLSKTSSPCSKEETDSNVASLGVRRKLKTFCRRRKSGKDTMKKRKSHWSFKFGTTKVRDCSTMDTSASYEGCICTVYRRTDISLDNKNPPEISPCKDAVNSDLIDDEESHLIESSQLTLSNNLCSSNEVQSISNNQLEILGDEVPKEDCLLETKANVVTAIIELENNNSSSAYHRCERQSTSELSLAEKAEATEQKIVEASTSNDAEVEGQAIALDIAVLDLVKFNPEEYPMEDWDERARIQRAKEMEEGVEPPPGYKPKQKDQHQDLRISELALYLQNHLLMSNRSSDDQQSPDTVRLSPNVLSVLKELTLASLFQTPVHTQVDYIHCLVPDLLNITNCSCYWGKMDRYEAEKLLENKPEGTFLLRDSAQEEFLFSVSFQRYGKTLHARIEQWNHKFSFDSHDPGVFSSATVCGLIEHYKDPSCCMYFDPMLTIPLHRSFTFSLQHLCRAVICNNITYDSINTLQLPKTIKSCLKEYHYKQRVKVRRFDY